MILCWCRSHCAGSFLLVSTYASQGVRGREYLCARVRRHKRYPARPPQGHWLLPWGGDFTVIV